MLQWMGGSRRKVAASHTSVKKRQKQYFEQRRQLQHHHFTGANEQHPREHQSLDILNLLNLSTSSPHFNPPSEKPHRDASSYIPNNNNISRVGDAARYSAPSLASPLNHQAEPISAKRTLFSIPHNQTNQSADLMDGTERKLSVFDLVGDDHATTDLEECSPSEAHMAFSVEGLGQMNTQTPNHSPQPSNRNFAYRCSSPWKDTGQPDTSNVREKLHDFEKELDTIIQSSKMFEDDSYMSPIGIHDKDRGRKQKMRNFSDHLHKPYMSNSRSYFGDAADFNPRRFSGENEWNDKSVFPDDGEDSFYWRDQQLCQEETLNLNFMNYGKDFTESRSSAEHHGTKKRDYLETTWRSNIEDSPVRIPQRLERTIKHPCFVNAAYFESPENFDSDNGFDQPVWSSIVPEEDKDRLSLRSEESCSSSAVWANEPSISQFENNTRQRKREVNSFCNLEDKNYANNDLFQESWENWEVDDKQLKRKGGSGKQVRLSNPGKLKSTSQKDSSFLDAPYNWFAEGFTSAGISSDITTKRDKPYSFLNPELGSSHWRQSRAPDSTPKTWVPKFSVGGTGDDDGYDYVNSFSPNHKSKLSGDMSGFESDTLSENNNEQSKEVNQPTNQRDETSSSVAKRLSDENECNPSKARRSGKLGIKKTKDQEKKQVDSSKQ